MKKVIGLVLLAVGVIGLVWGGFSYVKDSESVDVGVAELTVQDKENVPIPPVLAGAALLAGVLLLVIDRRGRG